MQLLRNYSAHTHELLQKLSLPPFNTGFFQTGSNTSYSTPQPVMITKRSHIRSGLLQ
jgi:hypothetical protein